MKKKNKFAAIDIGSHNCRLLIVEKKTHKLHIHFNSATPTNLIKNLSFNNEFNFKNISKTVDCLKKFKKKWNILMFLAIDALPLKLVDL